MSETEINHSLQQVTVGLPSELSFVTMLSRLLTSDLTCSAKTINKQRPTSLSAGNQPSLEYDTFHWILSWQLYRSLFCNNTIQLQYLYCVYSNLPVKLGANLTTFGGSDCLQTGHSGDWWRHRSIQEWLKDRKKKKQAMVYQAYWPLS